MVLLNTKNCEKVTLPVNLNSKFIIGTEGAHLNISGISGLASKTSYAMFLLKAIQDSYMKKDPKDEDEDNIMTGKIQFGDNMFFTTGYLYATEDMSNFTRITFPDSQIVYDVFKDENYLYALCANKCDDVKYKVSVYRNDGQNLTNFHEIFNFIYEVPPLSIACQDGDFFIGMGDTNNNHDKNGTIIFIEYA